MRATSAITAYTTIMMGLFAHWVCGWFVNLDPPYWPDERPLPATGDDAPRDCPVLLLDAGICDFPLPRAGGTDATVEPERPLALALAPAPTATGRASVSAWAGSCDVVPLVVSPAGAKAATSL